MESYQMHKKDDLCRREKKKEVQRCIGNIQKQLKSEIR